MTYVLETNVIFKVTHIEDQKLMLANLIKNHFFFLVILQESKLENNILLEKTVALKQNTYIDVKYRIN